MRSEEVLKVLTGVLEAELERQVNSLSASGTVFTLEWVLSRKRILIQGVSQEIDFLENCLNVSPDDEWTFPFSRAALWNGVWIDYTISQRGENIVNVKLIETLGEFSSMKKMFMKRVGLMQGVIMSDSDSIEIVFSLN